MKKHYCLLAYILLDAAKDGIEHMTMNHNWIIDTFTVVSTDRGPQYTILFSKTIAK